MMIAGAINLEGYHFASNKPKNGFIMQLTLPAPKNTIAMNESAGI